MYFSILLLFRTCLLHVVTSAQCFQMHLIFVPQNGRIHIFSPFKAMGKIAFSFLLLHEAWIVKYVVFSILQSMV
jgi:hypothetical protein